MKCIICNLEFNEARQLVSHIRHTHDKLSSKDYYDLYLKKEGEGTCLLCGSVTCYNRISTGYKKFCGTCILKSLDSYILAYGQEEGLRLYNERVDKQKISSQGINKGEKNGNYKAPKKSCFCGYCGKPLERTANDTAKLNFCNRECKRQWQILNPNNKDLKYMRDAFQKKYGDINPMHLPEAKEALSKKNTKTNERFIQDLCKVNTNVSPIDLYINDNTKILFKCHRCAYKWKVKPNAILQGQGCPRCNMSKGENKIAEFLKLNCVEYIPQKSFEGCNNILPLYFDFYLPDYNLCIEFDGEQHFKSNVFKFNRTEKEQSLYFEKVKHRDSIKTQYCEDHNIFLLRIPYWDIKNISQILTKELQINHVINCS